MAIQLYRAGDTHEVRGILCEVGNFEPHELDVLLAQGWAKDPKDIGGVPEEPKAEIEPDTLNPVRLQAKEAGIEGWENKRIKTLEAELAG